MDDKKKLEIFDRCVSKELQNYLDEFNDKQIDNICESLSGMIESHAKTIKVQMKILAHKHRKY